MNQKVFLQLVMPLKDKVFRLAKRLLISHDEAEDATQELYYKLWSNKEQLETYKNIEAYALVMTKNYCLDRLKSKQATNLTLVHNNFKGNEEDIHRKLELKDEVNLVHQLITKLPEQQRMVIQLRDIEQYDYNEIELIMGINPTAIRVNLSRARKTIREELIKQFHYAQNI